MGTDEALVRALRILQATTAGVEGPGYYGALVRGLAEAFGMRYALVAEIGPAMSGRVAPLAFWDGAGLAEFPPYDLRGTPCEGVAGGQVCVYPSGVARLFPADEVLSALGIESYVGVPIAGAGGEVLGILAAFDPVMKDEARPVAVLSGFAARAGWHIERARLIQRLERQARRSQALADIATGLHSAHARPDAALQATCAQIRDELGVSAVSVLLFSERGGQIERRAQVGFPEAWLAHHTMAGLAKKVLPLLDGPRVYGPEQVALLPDPHYWRTGVRGGALAPLRCEGQLVGVVTAVQFTAGASGSEAEARLLTREDLAWLDAVAGLLGQVVLASRLEARMLHAQKLESLGVLAGGIAHDFNNLLVGILGNVGLALRELPAGAVAAPFLRDVQRAAGRAAELTAQMLAYAGKGHITVQAVNLNAVVAEIAGLLAAVISKKARLVTDFAADLPDIAGDVTQIRQVVMNLITNASDALGERAGTITVTTRAITADRALLAKTYVDEGLPEGPYVLLSVADDGIGMDEATRARIFDPFFTTKFTGRGLGLAAVLGILRGHRGAIRVESEPGRGTCFTVLLPCAGAARPAATSAGDSGVRRMLAGGAMVMVADDEPAVRAVARRVLERAGYRVCVAGDGRAAVDLFAAHAPEIAVVVLDMTMPQLRGDEVLSELRRLRPDVRVVLSSGFDLAAKASQVGLHERVRFLPKPWTPEGLLAAVGGEG